MRLAKSDREVLESWLRAPTIPQELALRAKIVIATADGEGVRPLAARLGISPTTVCLWRRRYESEGLAGLGTRHRSGRRRSITDGKERAVVAATMKEPKDTTHWSTRRLSKEVGLSRASVHRIWRKYGPRATPKPGH